MEWPSWCDSYGPCQSAMLVGVRTFDADCGMTLFDDTYIFGCRDGVLDVIVVTSVETASCY